MQAYGGQICFLGQPQTMPAVHYGALPQDNPLALWNSSTCQHYRRRFEQRVKLYDKHYTEGVQSGMMHSLHEEIRRAKQEMPPPPEGCQHCHYLFDI